MESYLISRPSVPSAVPCALVSVAPPTAASNAVVATLRTRLPWQRQALIQHELRRNLLLTTGSNGTTGFMGVRLAKRPTTDIRGIPPRGRPA